MVEQFRLDNIKIRTDKPKLNKIMNSYSFYFIIESFNISNQILLQNLGQSKVIIIEKTPKNHQTCDFFIIGFKNTILIIKESLIHSMKDFFSAELKIPIYFLFDIKNIFHEKMEIKNEIIISDNNFNMEIASFNDHLKIDPIKPDHPINKMSSAIKSCILGYLIQESYYKLHNSKKVLFNPSQIFENNLQEGDDVPITIHDENDFIELRPIGQGSIFNIALIYEIERGELLALKKPITEDDEKAKLINREYNNYQLLKHPQIPKFYCRLQKQDGIVIQLIEGKSLSDIKQMNLTFKDKINIIFQMMIIIQYLHENEFVYRDLKPDNIMVDENLTVFLIDFDRMLKLTDNTENQNHTNDFTQFYTAPEFNEGYFSLKSDIYSIGQMIYYIILNGDIKNNEPNKIENHNLHRIYMNTMKSPNERPTISELMGDFYQSLVARIFGTKYLDEIIKHAKELMTKDINKSILYFKLAANLNDAYSENELGLIYYRDKYIKKDIQKAIKHFTRAAKLNYSDSQFNLGVIYYEGKYVVRDINKSIYYFKQAADQNEAIAQNNLGRIYYEGKYVKQDMRESIRYLTLAADNDYPDSQFVLGMIYYAGIHVNRDMKKAIHYLTRAADQNDTSAQYNLSMFYHEGKYIKRDKDKMLKYLTIAANRDNPDAQICLGFFYLFGFYIKPDIIKGIDLIIRSAKNGNAKASFRAGFFYHEGIHVEKDIKKAIHFYKDASNNNIKEAKNNLGIIYKNGIDNVINKNIVNAIQYFDETIQHFNDELSMYNLAHIYIYEDGKEEKIDKSINLLIKSINKSFDPAANLLCIALIKKFNFDYVNIIQYLSDNDDISNLVFSKISNIIENKKLIDHQYFDEFFNFYKSIDYLYNYTLIGIESSNINKKTEYQQTIITGENITDDFYQGFG